MKGDREDIANDLSVVSIVYRDLEADGMLHGRIGEILKEPLENALLNLAVELKQLDKNKAKPEQRRLLVIDQRQLDQLVREGSLILDIEDVEIQVLCTEEVYEEQEEEDELEITEVDEDDLHDYDEEARLEVKE